MADNPRLRALEQLGLITTTKRDRDHRSISQEKVTSHYHRLATRTIKSEITPRRVDAFIGLCACRANTDSAERTETLLAAYKELLKLWPIRKTVIDDRSFSTHKLKHVSKSFFQALLDPEHSSRERFEIAHAAGLDLIRDVELQMPDHNSISTALVCLIGLLEVAADTPGSISYSNFVTLTTGINRVFRKLCAATVTPVSASFEALSIAFDPAQNLHLQLQNCAIEFVLRWAEHNCALLYSTEVARLWATIANADCYMSEETRIDDIIWTTVIEHAAVQYDLNNRVALSPISEAVLGRTLKAFCLASISADKLDPRLESWINNLVINVSDLDDLSLGAAIVQVLAALAIRFPATSQDFTRMLKDIIHNAPRNTAETDTSLASFAARDLLKVLEQHSKDVVVSTMYNFANYLNGRNAVETIPLNPRPSSIEPQDDTSMLSTSSVEDISAMNAVEAISVFGSFCHDAQVSALAQSILIQKSDRVSQVIQRKIVTELAAIALHCSDKDVLRAANHYAKVQEQLQSAEMNFAIQSARTEISRHLALSKSTAYQPYLESLLRAGIANTLENSALVDMSTILRPLATLLRGSSIQLTRNTTELAQLFHNFWFHLVIAGYHISSKKVSDNLDLLKDIARGSPSLDLETMTDSFESDLESYAILKQTHEHKDTKRLQSILEDFSSGRPLKTLSFGKNVYMNALALLENLKCQAGIATGSLRYFANSTLRQSDASSLLSAICYANTNYFLQAVRGDIDKVRLDRQLHELVVGTCSQIADVRVQAVSIIDQIVASIPTAFCSSLAIATLLESITLLGWACHEEFSDKYSPSYEFRSSRTNLSIIASDSFPERNQNLTAARRSAKLWIEKAMLDSAESVRTLLTSYVTAAEDHPSGYVNDKGKALAIELAMMSSPRDQPSEGNHICDASDSFLEELRLRHLQTMSEHHSTTLLGNSQADANGTKSSRTLLERSLSKNFIPFADLRQKLCSFVAGILKKEADELHLLRQLVEIPFNIFNPAALRLATSLWERVMTERADLSANLLAEISRCWTITAHHRIGFFSTSVDQENPFATAMEYAPTDKEAIAKKGKAAKLLLEPHLRITRFLSSRLATVQNVDRNSQRVLLHIVCRTLKYMKDGKTSNHIFARELSFHIVILGLKLKFSLRATGLSQLARTLSELVYDAALCIFSSPPRWAFGSDVSQLQGDRQLAGIFLSLMRQDTVIANSLLSQKTHLLGILLESEISRIGLWLQPLYSSRGTTLDETKLLSLLEAAWSTNPGIAVALVQRFSSPQLKSAVRALVLKRPWEVLKEPYAAEYLLGQSLSRDALPVLHYLVYWRPLVPITATMLFLPTFESNPLVVQYAMRSLESHAIDVTFFYVPQIVQVLRYDDKGYVQRFILETAKLSQLFAHQIIWNFDANAYKDEDATIPDPLKPTLDKIKEGMTRNLSGADKEFYETEFRFFGEVTAISGKLKPFIKKTKLEKKAKIDQEMALIRVEQGVYLPSNPDGQVIGIDRKSGRPLQSHAKAPFMATFYIRKSRQIESAFEDDLQIEDPKDKQSVQQKVDSYEKKQAAIFKVGDDCRQDMLALQLISTFRSIFNSIGLDLYVFPYRVTATAPGCGVIDVLPNSVSRDMLGREAVNGLYDYFVTTFGKPDTVRFQEARMSFVKSLAAYSVISYLLQFKDRHNGNIMYDSSGHILHIDFGFCFDIAPGGITFESAPFKLTTEMIAVMGGSADTQSYKMFQELCVKAFLVARQYSEQMIHLVTLMLDSGLPCFKGQTTITNLRNRFHLEASEQQASKIMLHLISQSHQNQRTVAYDVFQKMTNGIPH